MGIKQWVILLSVLVFIFGIYQASEAAVLDSVIIVFDEPTLQKGFPVFSPDQKFCVPVFPGFFKDKLSVKVSRATLEEAVPTGKKILSEVYLLDMKPGYQGVLKKAQLVSFSVNNVAEVKNPQINFYDRAKQIWRPLETKIDLKNNRVQAYTIFPYAKVAVLGENGNTAVVAAQPEVIEQAMSLTNLTAQAALVVDKNSGVELFRKNEVEIRPIASLTKLMSVLTFFDYFPGWDKVVTLEKQDFVGGAALWAKAGDQITVKDLFYSTLVGSKNNTTVALARSTGLTVDQFVAKMNDKAKTMGLINSRFVEPTGLSEYNVSTAKEIMSIARELFKNPEALKASTTQWYKVKPLNSVNYYWVKNTSIKLLERDLYITGSKTGWTDEAGYCLVTQAKKNGQELLALVLGAKVRMNYEEVYYLLNNYLN